MESVASTHRIRISLECLGYGTEILITHRTVCGNVNLYFLEMSAWLVMAAIGFAKLFNVPKGSLILAAVLAAIRGSCKLVLMHFGLHITLSTLIDAIVIVC
ncbi:MAG: hypothetical protein ACI9Q3_000568 [Maribacter sp.]|jgi:hypothetical protein